jgi:hypothetical protein
MRSPTSNRRQNGAGRCCAQCTRFPGALHGPFALSAVLLAGTGVDFITALGAVAATIGNIGPGFGMVGPVENFAHSLLGQVAPDLVHAAGAPGNLYIDHIARA